jgi:hypothetical protein
VKDRSPGRQLCVDISAIVVMWLFLLAVLVFAPETDSSYHRDKGYILLVVLPLLIPYGIYSFRRKRRKDCDDWRG